MAKEEAGVGIGNIIAKAVLGSMPGGPIATGAYELAQLLSGKMRDYLEERTERRLNDFHNSLLNGEESVSPEVADTLNIADYHALLNACVSDIEDEKTERYARLAQAVALGKVRQQWKRPLILAIKELDTFDLQILQNAYVAQRFELQPHQGAGKISPAELLSRDQDAISDIRHQRLIALGLATQDRLTLAGDTLAEACFSIEELTPEAVGLRQWKGVLSIAFAGEATQYVARIISDAWHRGYKTSQICIPTLDRVGLTLPANAHVLVCGMGGSADIAKNAARLKRIFGNQKVVVLQTEPNPHLDEIVALANVACVDAQGRLLNDIVEEALDSVLRNS